MFSSDNLKKTLAATNTVEFILENFCLLPIVEMRITETAVVCAACGSDERSWGEIFIICKNYLPLAPAAIFSKYDFKKQ